jgi:signal transduction histidine kinase
MTQFDQAGSEIERVQLRVRRLAEEKSNLQLVISLIQRLNPLPGMDDMMHAMLHSIVDTIGGTNIKLYYWVEDQLHYIDFLGANATLEEIDDPLARQAAQRREFVEQSGEASGALMRGDILPGAWNWAFPLPVGEQLIGVIKIENVHVIGASLASYLPPFFSHAALILSNEIRNHLRQETQAALLAKTEELKRSNAELEQFSYAISHDMRTPLRMISSYLELLEADLAEKLDPEQREYFNFAVDGAKRLDAMLVGLLEYSRVGRKGEPMAWTQSRAILDEVLLYLQPAIAEAGASVRIEGSWPRVRVSPDEILRLLQNLIGNAIKFRVAGRTPEVSVSSETADGEWRVSVADNGVGLAPDQGGRLFQVFQRMQLRSSYEGTGIGLALCRKIAEHHGGRIWVESEGQDLGSRFCVALPLAQEAA